MFDDAQRLKLFLQLSCWTVEEMYKKQNLNTHLLGFGF